jgi:hypothetical protein
VRDESEDLIDALIGSVSLLEAHKDFLDQFITTGGEIEYFVGWFTTGTSGGDTLPWELMRRMADLKINLDLTGNFCTSRIERLKAERNPGYAKESVYARADRAEAATD